MGKATKRTKGTTAIPLCRKWQERFRLFMTDSKLFSSYVGEKHVGLDKKRQAGRKERVLSLRTAPFSTRDLIFLAGLIPYALIN